MPKFRNMLWKTLSKKGGMCYSDSDPVFFVKNPADLYFDLAESFLLS